MPNRSQTFILGITPVQVLNRGKIHYPGITPGTNRIFYNHFNTGRIYANVSQFSTRQLKYFCAISFCLARVQRNS